MQITIIGAGNMARGIAIRALAGGHTVRIIDRAPDEAARLAALGPSAAEQIAAAAPAARVVKALNTTFAGTLIAGQAGGAPLDMFIAGDHATAKQAVTDLATSGGLCPIDAGPSSVPANWKASSSCTRPCSKPWEPTGPAQSRSLSDHLPPPT